MKKTLILAIVFFMTASGAYAMRCRNGLAQVGDSKTEVTQACGEPLKVDVVGNMFKRVSYEKDRKRVEREIAVPVEKWHYDVGGGVIHLLTFEGEDLVNIDDYRK